jgi:Calcineurin-like phosphoesterase
MADVNTPSNADTVTTAECSPAAGAATLESKVDPEIITSTASGVHVAIVGCAHGKLDDIYNSIAYMEEEKGIKISLLLCCGDFQAVRNEDDLLCLNCPPKYREMNTFYKYYSGEKTAPVLTIFIGGNHEASNYTVELYV